MYIIYWNLVLFIISIATAASESDTTSSSYPSSLSSYHYHNFCYSCTLVHNHPYYVAAAAIVIVDEIDINFWHLLFRNFFLILSLLLSPLCQESRYFSLLLTLLIYILATSATICNVLALLLLLESIFVAIVDGIWDVYFLCIIYRILCCGISFCCICCH